MSRQSTILWTGLTGILLFFAGAILDYWRGYEGNVHLTLATPEQLIRNPALVTIDSSPSAADSFSLRLDSLKILPFSPAYELQVRKADQAFEQQYHPTVIRPSKLENVYPLQPMKIRKIGHSDYRFRLKEFYPDFNFEYTYPLHQDTIAPIAPGITFNLKTSSGEEIVTLQSNQPKLHKLDDVVQLGCVFEFFWEKSPDSTAVHADSLSAENKIIFSGAAKKILFQFNGRTESMPLELNRFYSIPGKDTLGFTILQCFPDIAFLKALPASKSRKANNPVAGVEVWKLGGRSQEIYLYPTSSAKPAGQWNVPGTDFLLSLAIEHEKMVRNSQSYIVLEDTEEGVHKRLMFQGAQTLTYKGNQIKPIECDVSGYWITLAIQRNPGLYLKISGGIVLIFTIFFLFFGEYFMRKIKRPNDINHLHPE
jgi:hypothetical protein